MEYTVYNDMLLLIVILIIPLIAQISVMANYNKFKKVDSSCKLSGFEVARKILDNNELSNVHVVETGGNLSDHYDPSRKVVRLSGDVFHGTSISALSIAAHEVGHAIQDKEGYLYMRFRSLIFPIVNIATSLSYIIILIGIITAYFDLIKLGIALTLLGLVFQIVTLPVEFNASKRAKSELEKSGLVEYKENQNVSKVLNAAAMTYVAGVITSILEILRLVLIFNDRD